MSIISKRRSQQSVVDNRPTLMAPGFYEKGYVTKAEIIRFVDDSRPSDVEDMEAFIDFVKLKGTFNNTRRKRYDKGGVAYQYVPFNAAQGTNGAKVVLIGNLKQFIDDFHNGDFVTDFTLEDLVAEAEKV
ncbi:MAG: hypothetical protein JWR05_3384 [Mucilaginibacter sp.]|nr:hypothetical protein [Mucilaginibacter sp.]